VWNDLKAFEEDMLKQLNILETQHSKTASPLSLSRVGPRHVEASGFILRGPAMISTDLGLLKTSNAVACCRL
jgi:hypothetical protein